MKWLILILLITLLGLQYALWFSPNGIQAYIALRHAITRQQLENEQLIQRNQQLAQNIVQLKTNRDTIEERARNDLGFVQPDETFYQIVTPEKNASTEKHSPWSR